MLYCLFSPNVENKHLNCELANSKDIFTHSETIIKDLESLRDFACSNEIDLTEQIDNYINQIKHRETLTMKVRKEIEEIGFLEYGNKYGAIYKTKAYDNRFKFQGYEQMELSTQFLIKEAVTNGLRVDVLDEHDNFIKLTNSEGKFEYIKQATKTSKDSYVSVMAMEK